MFIKFLSNLISVSTAVFFLARLIVALGTITFNLVLGRSLGSEAVGIFMMAFSLVVGFGVLSRVGLENALLRFASIAYSDSNRFEWGYIKSWTFLVAGFASLVLAGILWIGRGYLALDVFEESKLARLLEPMAILLPLYTLLCLQVVLFKAFRQPVMACFFEVGTIFFAVSVIFMVSNSLGLTVGVVDVAWILCCVLLVAGGLAFGLLRIVAQRRFGAVAWFPIRIKIEDSFLASLPDYTLISLASYLVQWVGILIIGGFVSAGELGVFSVAHRLALSLTFFLILCNSVLGPRLASLYSQGRMAELDRLVRNSTLCMLVVAIPVALLLICFPSYFLGLFGVDFQRGANLLVILVLGQLINIATGPVGLLLNMCGLQRQVRNILIFSAFFTSLITLLLVPRWGVTGAALATTIAVVLQNLLVFWRARLFMMSQILKRKVG
ncbi:oligosaccharide flippase family protein [Pseudomonas lopnurensis]|uniref:oligosaccharide flippase family protein n=1 Tax=Pseudomonas lopnurensis TaxID=1477517 RepID=UPI002E2AAA4A|nr:oligosaccharide flippase family protein [Pseudomonas lopnurensis]